MQRHYLRAAHSYFHVTNKAEQKRRFLDDGTFVPQFAYHDHFDIAVVQGNLSQALEDEAKRSLQLVLSSLALQEAEPEQDTLRKFRKLNTSLFGTPRPEYVQAILVRIEGRVTPKTAKLWKEVCQRVEFKPEEAIKIAPDRSTFLRYHNYFQKYYKDHASPDDTLITRLERALKQTGLTKKGWRVRTIDDVSHARVTQAKKVISVGLQYYPRTARSAERIVAHEVYGHALRGPQPSIAESEGVAVLFEQLLDNKFKFLRAYRYLAAALGWGESGEPRTFREVYEIIWRVMVITSRYSEENAKSYAFDECVRVFRGGRPDQPGMVFLKDMVYFAANVDVWDKLKQQPLAYNEFIDVIEGRRKVLS